MKTHPRLYIECEKHGKCFALPVAEGGLVLRPKDYPPNVEELRRVCAMCLAESMIQPTRQSQPAREDSNLQTFTFAG